MINAKFEYTKIDSINENSLIEAKNILSSGGIVAFPTETVYGLGADARSDDSVRGIFEAKGRPSDNPLIVHFGNDKAIDKYIVDNPLAKKLREAFLPGPLTMVYESLEKVSPLVSCGLKTLAIRIPASEEARRFLDYVDMPIAAPSANISKHTSPVTAEHVFEDFDKRIPLILDGGRCLGGIESTVLDVTTSVPVILRKGLITAEMVASVVGKCENVNDDSELKKRSPGTRYRHYSPNVESTLFKKDELEKARALYDDYINKGKKPYIMCDSKSASYFGNRNIFDLGKNGNEMASRLYFYLHEAERVSDFLIGIEFNEVDEVCLSVKNRFLKAFGKDK